MSCPAADCVAPEPCGESDLRSAEAAYAKGGLPDDVDDELGAWIAAHRTGGGA